MKRWDTPRIGLLYTFDNILLYTLSVTFFAFIMTILPLLFPRILLFALASTTLTASAMCDASYGKNIQYEHCAEALSVFPLLYPRDVEPVLQQYSRDARTARKRVYSMPQAYTWRTCSIGVDLADLPRGSQSSETANSRSVSETPRTVLALMKHVMDQCVRSRGVGGRLQSGGLDVVIIHPGSGLGKGTCLAPLQSDHESLGSFIAYQAGTRGRSDPLVYSPPRKSAPIPLQAPFPPRQL